MLPFAPLHSTSDTILAQGVFHSNENPVEILLLSWVRDNRVANSVFGKPLIGTGDGQTTRCGVYAFGSGGKKATSQANPDSVGEQKAKLLGFGLECRLAARYDDLEKVDKDHGIHHQQSEPNPSGVVE